VLVLVPYKGAYSKRLRHGMLQASCCVIVLSLVAVAKSSLMQATKDVLLGEIASQSLNLLNYYVVPGLMIASMVVLHYNLLANVAQNKLLTPAAIRQICMIRHSLPIKRLLNLKTFKSITWTNRMGIKEKDGELNMDTSMLSSVERSEVLKSMTGLIRTKAAAGGHLHIGHLKHDIDAVLKNIRTSHQAIFAAHFGKQGAQTGAEFMERSAPNGQTWREYCGSVPPARNEEGTVVRNKEGKLIGNWGECLNSAISFESTDGSYPAVSQVKEFCLWCGYGKLETGEDVCLVDEFKHGLDNMRLIGYHASNDEVALLLEMLGGSIEQLNEIRTEGLWGQEQDSEAEDDNRSEEEEEEQLAIEQEEMMQAEEELQPIEMQLDDADGTSHYLVLPYPRNKLNNKHGLTFEATEEEVGQMEIARKKRQMPTGDLMHRLTDLRHDLLSAQKELSVRKRMTGSTAMEADLSDLSCRSEKLTHAVDAMLKRLHGMEQNAEEPAQPDLEYSENMLEGQDMTSEPQRVRLRKYAKDSISRHCLDSVQPVTHKTLQW